MMKKVFISIGALVLITTVTFGILFFLQPNTPAQEPTDEAPVGLVVDTSKDYQACTTLNTATIQSALGEPASDLQAPNNLGVIGEQVVGEGVESISADSQTCIYAFVAGGNEENGFNADNAFIVNKTVYINTGGPAAVIDQIAQDQTITELDVASGQAFYVANTSAEGPEAISSFDLYVFVGNERTTYTIRQPADATTFTAESAQTALRSLAEQAE